MKRYLQQGKVVRSTGWGVCPAVMNLLERESEKGGKRERGPSNKEGRYRRRRLAGGFRLLSMRRKSGASLSLSRNYDWGRFGSLLQFQANIAVQLQTKKNT